MTSKFKSALRSYARCSAIGLFCLVAACEEPRPISFAEFMEDDIARDGTLARCNMDREATSGDIECANARRAASAIALRDERARREAYEAESERRIADLRAEVERERVTAQEAQQRAEAAARAAYEAQWEERNGAAVGVDGQPLAPEGAQWQRPGDLALQPPATPESGSAPQL